MNKTLLISLVLSTQVQAKSFLDYLVSPRKLDPAVQACVLQDDQELMAECVKDLCTGYNPNMYPMMVTDEKFESFIQSHTNPPADEVLKKQAARFQSTKDRLIKSIDRLLAKTPEQIMAETTDVEKSQWVTSLFSQFCSMTVDHARPEAERITYSCEDEQLQNHPIKKVITDSMIAKVTDDMDTALMLGFYTINDIAAKIPSKEASVKNAFDKLKASKPEDEDNKFLIEYMDKNWGKYSTLDYANRIRYMKGLMAIQHPDAESDDGNSCQSKVCVTAFDDMIKKKVYQDELKKVKTQLASEEFEKLANVSMKIQGSLLANAPSEEDIKAFEPVKKEVIKKLLDFQKSKMSEHSFEVYEERLDAAIISLDDSLLSEETESDETETPVANEFQYPTPMILGLANSNVDTLLMYTTVGQGIPFSIVSDHYIDPILKDFHDDGFDETQIKFSLFSLKEKGYGAQILAHELGHHFSQLHTTGDFSELTSQYVAGAKACVKSRYEKFYAKTGKDAGSNYLEEEFSDEFGFTIDTIDPKMLFCPVLINTPKAELSLGIMTVLNTHPQDLWRSLNQLKYSNKAVPASCKELMIKNADSYEYKRCL